MQPAIFQPHIGYPGADSSSAYDAFFHPRVVAVENSHIYEQSWPFRVLHQPMPDGLSCRIWVEIGADRCPWDPVGVEDDKTGGPTLA